MIQKIKKDKILILEAKTHLVTVDMNGKPIKIPEVLEKFLKEWIKLILILF